MFTGLLEVTQSQFTLPSPVFKTTVHISSQSISLSSSCNILTRRNSNYSYKEKKIISLPCCFFFTAVEQKNYNKK